MTLTEQERQALLKVVQEQCESAECYVNGGCDDTGDVQAELSLWLAIEQKLIAEG